MFLISAYYIYGDLEEEDRGHFYPAHLETLHPPRTMASFEDAAAVTQVTPHAYTAHFPEDWCIGSGSLENPHTRKNLAANVFPQFPMAGS
jgi:hypothetical protein